MYSVPDILCTTKMNSQACITAQAEATGSEDPAPEVGDQEETENKFDCNMTGMYNKLSKRFKRQIKRMVKKEKKIIFQYSRPSPGHRAEVICKWEKKQLLCRPFTPGPTNGCQYICRKDAC